MPSKRMVSMGIYGGCTEHPPPELSVERYSVAAYLALPGSFMSVTVSISVFHIWPLIRSTLRT